MANENAEQTTGNETQEALDCNMCFSVPLEQLEGDISGCRILSAVQNYCTPTIYEAAVVVMNKSGDGPFTRSGMADMVAGADETGPKKSTALQRVTNALSSLRKLFGDEIVTSEGGGQTQRQYQIDPAALAKVCESGEVLDGANEKSKPAGKKKQVLPVSFQKYDVIPGLAVCIENYVLKGEDDDLDMAIQQNEGIRATIFAAIETCGPVLAHSSVSRGLKNVLSDKTVRAYGSSSKAHDRFALVASIAHRATANL